MNCGVVTEPLPLQSVEGGFGVVPGMALGCLYDTLQLLHPHPFPLCAG